ncbi:LRR receptor serine/threonine-protein kinase [Spatholobus suberectus]|nr:LRR receptor serine/threonine-protein kinase [Spatholobus suberectus]
MQTAVVGTRGVLSYRLNLEDFPANARAYAYFAEIEDLGKNESRKFKLKQPYIPDYSNAVVNIAENANGSYTLYEPSYMNVTLEFVLSFSFVMAPDSYSRTSSKCIGNKQICTDCFEDRQTRLNCCKCISILVC